MRLADLVAGLCRGSEDPRYALDEHARAVDPEIQLTCWRCPVRKECLEFALDNEVDDGEWGVWGGLTPFQRQQLKRERSRVFCPGCRSDAVSRTDRGETCLSCGVSWLT